MLPPTSTRALLLLLAAAACALAGDKAIPDYLHICKTNDPQLGNCIKESVESLRPQLAAGVPELNLPPLEPLYLRQLVLNQNPNMHVVANDIKAYQVTSFVLRNVTVNDDKTLFHLYLDLPTLNVVGTYSVDGRLLLLPVKGSGPIQLNATDVKASVDFHTGIEERDGEKYVTLKSLNVDILEVKKASIRLDNLFGGDKILGEVVNSAVNANFDQVLKELKPSVERALQETLLEIVEKILSSFPERQLFPED